jgi:hypothetical protein
MPLAVVRVQAFRSDVVPGASGGRTAHRGVNRLWPEEARAAYVKHHIDA